MNRRNLKIMNNNRLAALLPVVLIALVSFAVYFNALFNEFAHDDMIRVAGNPWIRDIRLLPKLFSWDVKIWWPFTKEKIRAEIIRNCKWGRLFASYPEGSRLLT